jgi:plasmid maintenance system antidote protein VapI
MNENPQVDDQNTNQAEAAELLRNLRDNAFDSNEEKLAVALGRPAAEIQSFINGEETIDDDVLIKARGIASERGIEE